MHTPETRKSPLPPSLQAARLIHANIIIISHSVSGCKLRYSFHNFALCYNCVIKRLTSRISLVFGVRY